MPTLLICLAGPMQSWGTRSQFDVRDTEMEPSKSGVLGLLCAASGIDREDWEGLKPLTHLTMGVRVDQPGVLRQDFQTAQIHPHKTASATALTSRHYLADARFLVGLEGESDLLQRLREALENPHWPLCLGRKAYLPSPAVGLKDGYRETDLETSLKAYPLESNGSRTRGGERRIRLVLESKKPEGSLRFDVPIDAFAARRYGPRYVRSTYFTVGGAS